MNIEKIGIGVDIEEVKRFEKYAVDSAFVKKIYTPNEIEYCFSSKRPSKHLAVRFCAKEAIYKAFCSVGLTNLGFQDVEIINDSNSVPRIVFLSEKTNGYSAKLSLSHGKEQAVESVVVINNN